MAAHNIIYVYGASPLIAQIPGSDFTEAILATFHLNQNPALQTFRILTGITTIFRATEDFTPYVTSLNNSSFSAALRQASNEGFVAKTGASLSNDVTVTVNESGSSWTLTDNSNQATYPIQLDLTGTYISYNSGPLGPSVSYQAEYVTQLNGGTIPSTLEALLPASTSGYTVTQIPAQTSGLPQWMVTNGDNDYDYYIFVKIPSPGSAKEFIVGDYAFVYGATMQPFWNEIAALSNANFPMLASFGGYNVDGDWQVMGQNLPQTLIVMADLFDSFGISGADLDWEAVNETPQQVSADVTAMTSFTTSIQAQRPGSLVTLCPYPGTLGTLLQVWQNVGLDNVSWVNAQMYDPNNNPPSLFKDTYLPQVAQAFKMSESSDAAPYLVPGWTATNVSLKTIEGYVKDIAHEYPDVGGAFIWNLDGINDATAWAAGIEQALEDALSATSEPDLATAGSGGTRSERSPVLLLHPSGLLELLPRRGR